MQNTTVTLSVADYNALRDALTSQIMEWHNTCKANQYNRDYLDGIRSTLMVIQNMKGGE